VGCGKPADVYTRSKAVHLVHPCTVRGSYHLSNTMALLLQVFSQCWPEHPLCAGLILSIWLVAIVIYGWVVPWIIGAYVLVTVWRHIARPAALAILASLGARRNAANTRR